MSQPLQRSGEGERIELGSQEIVIRLSADDTDGAFSLVEYTADPDGRSPPPHYHEETDEVIFVLDGTIQCTVAGENFSAEAGDTVWIPRGTVHTFSVTGSRPAWLLGVISPGGFEGYFEEMGEYLASLDPGPPDPEQVQRKAAELMEVYDQTVVETGE